MLQPMAALGVLNFNLPPGLTMKLNNIMTDKNSNMNSPNTVGGGIFRPNNKTFNKITVQNVLSENSGNALNIAQGNPNAIVRKIKDFGMIGTVNSAGANTLNITNNSRKRPISENTKTITTVLKQRNSTSSVSKKPKLTKEERASLRMAKKAAKENATTLVAPGVVVPTKIPGTPGRKGLPLPQAVARRNARERNRVKQVNNGFAALRERIPEEVAEAFEAHSSCKNNGKKLSKVETLRMAVEYIRSLERLLGFDFPLTSGKSFLCNSSSGEDSFSMIKDEFDAFSPSVDEEHYDDSLSHYDSEEYFAPQLSPAAAEVPPANLPQQNLPQIDTLPNITTLNGLQYIRIPGTNTYQLLTPDIFVGSAASPPLSTVDDEHFNALIDVNCISPTAAAVSMPSPTLATAMATNTTTTTNVTTSLSLAHATSDPNASPPSIRPSSSMCMTSSPVPRTAQHTTAPVATQIERRSVNAEGSESLLSSSPSSPSSSSKSTSTTTSSPVPHQQQQLIISQMLTTSSPSATSAGNTTYNNNDPQDIATLQATTPANEPRQQQGQDSERNMEDLRQACAANRQEQREQQQQQQQIQQQQQQQQMQHQHQHQHHQQQQQLLQLPIIKQEFEETTIIYQQQQPQQHQPLPSLQHHLFMQAHNSMTMSPPLEHQTPTTSHAAATVQLQQFFNPSQQTMFFDNGVHLKKEFTEDLLDGPHTSNVLSDESMIETIDWWEAHTPKSEGGSVMM